MRLLAVSTLVMLGFSAPPSVTADAAPHSITFELVRPGEIVVQAMLNGSGPFPFLLDTGSSHSAISEDLAQMLGAPAVAMTTVVSPIGQDVRVVVRLERLDLGPVTADGVLASVVGQGALDTAGRIHGIIGQDVLAPRRYTLDFRSRRVAWHAGPPVGPHRGSTLMLQFEAGRFLVELPQRRSVLRLVPDSGAAGLVLFERHGHPALPISLAPGLADMATLNQRQAVRPAWVGELRVGFAILRNLPAVVVHRSGSASSEGDGLLPLHLFDRVTFSGPEGLLIVEERV